MATAAFGIDFGTTNTRVAYFNGETVQIVQFTTGEGTVSQLPTAVAYRHGQPVAFGAHAQTLSAGQGTLFPKPLKWLLKSPEPVEVGDGQTRDPGHVVADFLKNLKQLVALALPRAPLDRAAVTIPVHYPTDARRRLALAFRDAGIAVTNYFYEPIAALYAGAIGDPASGTAAVFDWGGGSLDVAAVELRDGMAMTRQVDGWHRGGTDFDRALAAAAVNEFLNHHRDHPNAEGLSTNVILGRMADGHRVRAIAEGAKLDLATAAEAVVVCQAFLNIGMLDYMVSRADFAGLIAPDLNGAFARLDRVLAASEVTPRTVARLFLSGGTCHLRDVRDRLAPVYGSRLTSTLRLPKRLVNPRNAGGLDDIGNATAVGAALLAAHGTAPVFAADVGVRLAGGDGDRFHTVFRRGDPVPFGKPVPVQFFVSDASANVARLLICDRDDPVTQPAGRLLRVVAVPIERTELWVNAEFEVGRNLTLRVRAAGRKNQSVDPTKPVSWPNEPADFPDLKLGFPLPPAA